MPAGTQRQTAWCKAKLCVTLLHPCIHAVQRARPTPMGIPCITPGLAFHVTAVGRTALAEWSGTPVARQRLPSLTSLQRIPQVPSLSIFAEAAAKAAEIGMPLDTYLEFFAPREWALCVT